MSTDGFSAAYLKDVARGFRNYKMLGDGALAQVSDEDFYRTIDPDANSIANLVKHVGGNLESRFRDFLTSDGEKPDRDRDAEFEFPRRPSRAELLGTWETGWKTTLAAIDALTPADLERTVTIRSEAFLVVEALDRAVTHTAYHVGQIALLAKHFAGPRWKTLSVPKGQSAQYAKGTFKQGIIPKG
jgi:Protein of unknown function (DUF1572)